MKKGEKILAIAIDDAIVIKKILDKSFEETVKPMRTRVGQRDLAEDYVNVLIEDSRCFFLLA